MAKAYYNEIDPFCAEWLRNLIAEGVIAHGDVDERDIREVSPDDLVGYTQCHFFAGIGGWSHALRLAGWPDDRPIWTGSCPCQPFSQAGKRKGIDDDRHLWPEWFRLIRERRPPTIIGEQVASKAALAWLDSVYDDMEGAGYAVGAADLCAASVGAPHIRQRLWFVARLVGDAKQQGLEGWILLRERAYQQPVGKTGMADSMADANCAGLSDGCASTSSPRQGCAIEPEGSHGAANSADIFWSNCDWLYCSDGKWRPVESGAFPLVDGVPARVGRLRAYGNAIVPQVAAEVIRAFMDAAA